MNLLAILSLIGAGVNLSIAIYVLSINHRHVSNRILSLFLISFCFWDFWDFMYRIAPNAELAVNYHKILTIGTYFVIALLSHVIIIFTDSKKILKNKLIYLALYLPAIILIILNWTTNLINNYPEIKAVYEDWHTPYAKPFGVIILFYILIFAVANLIVCWKAYKRAISEKKKQVSLALALASFSAILLAAIGRLILPLFSNVALPELLTAPMTITAAGFVLFSIKKYGFLVITPNLAAETIISATSNLLLVTNSKGIVEIVSPKTLQLTGYKEEEIIGKPVLNFFSKESYDILKTKVLMGMIVKNANLYVIDKKGKEIILEINSAPIGINRDTAMGVVIAGEDIREKKRLIADLEQIVKKLEKTNKNLKQLNKMKTDFLTIASHQLRTPATIIRGMLSMLVSGELDKKLKEEFIQKAFESSNRLEKLITDLLDATRLEGKEMMMKFEATQINDIVEKTVKDFQMMANKKGILFKLKKEEKLPIIMVDRKRIRQVISNFIDNAIRYTEKGSIIITTKHQDSSVIISIKDTGIGLSEEEKEKLFQKFFRSERATKLAANGSGLGLFIGQKIVEEHNGRIEVESKGKGKGSTFRLILPFLS